MEVSEEASGEAGEAAGFEVVEEVMEGGAELPVEVSEEASGEAGEAAAGEQEDREQSIREAIQNIKNTLQDSGLSAADKISRIFSAVNEMVGEALAAGGRRPDEEELAGVREMIANITGNLDVLAREDLSGFDVVEEIVDEDTAQGGASLEIIELEETPPGESMETLSGAADQEIAVEAAIEAVDEPMTELSGVEEIFQDAIQDALGMEAGELAESVAGFASEAGETVEEIIEETVAGEGGAGYAGMEDAAGEAPAESDSLEVAEEVEEVVEEAGREPSAITVIAVDGATDSELREKTDLLTRLAEAAGVLRGLGPDLSSSVYTEEEIRGSARFLSEEFDRYLSMRDKYYNAHILIKGGDFLVGGEHLAKSVLEEQIVTLPDFFIGKFPVTNAVFEIFVEQTGYITTAEKYGYSLVYFPRMQRSRDPVTGVERFALHKQAYSRNVPGACWHMPFGPDSSLHMKRSHPVVQVSFEDAQAFAAWTGKRLPTEIEWEAAARTPRGLVYPWGGQWQEGACNIEQSLHGDTTPVDLYIKFANAAEVADMLGNVLEWTIDVIGDQETSETHIVKGASWISHDDASLADRHYIEKKTASNILGFRCVAI